jgi:3-oxoacyl-[acyl-carrier-protein] synthase II
MNRVLVTGLGAVTSIGIGCEAFWKAVLEQKCGFTEVTSIDTSRFKVHIGAEIHGFDPASYFRCQDPDSMGRTSQLAVAAAREALEDCGLDRERLVPERAGTCIGTTSGEPLEIESLDDRIMEERLTDCDSRFPFRYPCHVIAAHVAREFSFSGVNQVIPTACAAGNYAVAYAMDVLLSGRADIMLAGGADAFSRITYTGFHRLGAISADVVRPFDKNRQGMIPGEGAGMLVLETEEHAISRGAHIYAEIVGYGLSCDAYHMTGPHPDGDGAARAIQMALQRSHLNQDDVDYICAHGTGTKASDKAETKAVRKAFGTTADKIPISSLKSMLGHTMGAASAIEAVACAKAVSTDVIPPTANWETADPECDLDYVTEGPREQTVRVAMNNANAFGGNNASLVLRKYST